jgi:hypothetical protein
VRTIPLCVLLPVSFLSVSLTRTCTHPSTLYFCLWFPLFSVVSVGALATNATNTRLFTGDSLGTIKSWNIERCASMKESHRRYLTKKSHSAARSPLPHHHMWPPHHVAHGTRHCVQINLHIEPRCVQPAPSPVTLSSSHVDRTITHASIACMGRMLPSLDYLCTRTHFIVSC